MSGPSILFAGPSLSGVKPALYADFDVRPPIRRGDVDRLLDTGCDPILVVVADGLFHHYPSVGHAELRRAIETGWTVWGVSSMGAIRAAEMQSVGMRGFGQVFEMFAHDPDFTDDEVALLHLGEPRYIAVTQPLVHIRCFLDSLLVRDLIDRNESRAVLDGLKALWFGYRDVARFADLLRAHTRLAETAIAEELRDSRRYWVKNQDLEALLRTRPWLT